MKQKNIVFCLLLVFSYGYIEADIKNAAPGKITDLTAVSDFQIKLNWTVPKGYLNGLFSISLSSQTKDTPDTAINQLFISNTTTVGGETFNITILDLQPRTTYYFWVRTLDEKGNCTLWSNKAKTVSGSFIDINAELMETYDVFLDWKDYDGDGDLDLIFLANTEHGLVSKIYRNENGNFVDVNIETKFINIYHGWPAPMYTKVLDWGDYDHDGDLDLIFSSLSNRGGRERKTVTEIYRNDNGYYVGTKTKLPEVDGVYIWGDYDGDGYLDLALAGSIKYPRLDVPGGIASFLYGVKELMGLGVVSKIYHNDNGKFVAIKAKLVGVSDCALSWGDYDADGDLDLAISGDTGSGDISKIYRNDNGNFIDINAGLSGVHSPSLSWGDYDKDGDLDLALTGVSTSGPTSRVYRNDNGNFVDISAKLPGVYNCSVNWGDFEGDGDLDLIYTGKNEKNSRYVQIFVNEGKNFVERDLGLNLGLFKHAASPLILGDYDQDGDLDLAFSVIERRDRSGVTVTKIFKSLEADWKKTNKGVVFANYKKGDKDVRGNFKRDTELMAVDYGCLVWGDYDNDGDLDLALAGYDKAQEAISKIYRNDQGNFVDINAVLMGVRSSSLSWGDYDNDGDLDLVLMGYSGVSNSRWVSKIYRNDRGNFVDINAGLIEINTEQRHSLEWIDYDKDGDLDLVLAGELYLKYTQGEERFASKIYRNDAGNFVDINIGLVGVAGSLDFGDYDNDGDLDLALAGWGGRNIGAVSRIYRNDNGNYVDANAGLQGASEGSLNWIDYDKDGDLDLTLAGFISSVSEESDDPIPATKIYRNEGGNFIDINAGLAGMIGSPFYWGDFDCDGDLDLALGQYKGNEVCDPSSKIYRNDTGRFVEIAEFYGHFYFTPWGDYDNDGDLDLAFTRGQIGKIYANDNGNFVDSNIDLMEINYLSWVDYDKDGDLDLGGTTFYKSLRVEFENIIKMFSVQKRCK